MLMLSAVSRKKTVHVWSDLPNPLRQTPIIALRNHPLPTLETAPRIAVDLIAEFCDPTPARVRQHLNLLVEVASILAQYV
jgi:hypothetical protein